MARSIKSEAAANLAMSETASRADWRAILASRDARRAEYRYRQARRTQSGRIAPVLCALFVVAAAFPVVSFFS